MLNLTPDGGNPPPTTRPVGPSIPTTLFRSIYPGDIFPDQKKNLLVSDSTWRLSYSKPISHDSHSHPGLSKVKLKLSDWNYGPTKFVDSPIPIQLEQSCVEHVTPKRVGVSPFLLSPASAYRAQFRSSLSGAASGRSAERWLHPGTAGDRRLLRHEEVSREWYIW